MHTPLVVLYKQDTFA